MRFSPAQMSISCFSKPGVNVFFFFNDTAPTEIYTLSLHDALPISTAWPMPTSCAWAARMWKARCCPPAPCWRSEEHTSELQSHSDFVCRLLLEQKIDLGQHQAEPDPAICGLAILFLVALFGGVLIG